LYLLTYRIGDINEQHPELLPTLTFSIVVLLIPESWILRPILGWFGFGPLGPVKRELKPWNRTFEAQLDIVGSAAARMQRRFWGGAVRAGSWFSCLQAAGMGVLPWWAGLVTKAPLIGGGWATLFFVFNRG